jgi:hypothetical protein
MIRKRGSRYQVLVYDVATGRKRSVGTRGTWREARQLEAANVRDRPSDKAPLVREFAALWFDVYSRPEPTTNRHNRQMVKPFLATFGDRPLDTIGRAEAKAWAQRHPHAAKVAAALFNDAIDAEAAEQQPVRPARPRSWPWPAGRHPSDRGAGAASGGLFADRA